MVRVDLLNSYNNLSEKRPLDDVFNRLGGILLTNCFTPGPDTPRSIACMQTGLLPFFNGCNTRIKWPRYFIKDEISTIFDHAVDKGMDVNLCVEDHYYTTGFFRYKSNSNINKYSTISDFIKNANFSANSLSFIGTPDYHYAMDDYGYSEKGVEEGHRVIGQLFEEYLTDDFINSFDYTFIFSDHGHSLASELPIENSIDLLKNGRTNILMYYKDREATSLIEDNRLASITDLYATIEDLIGDKDFRDGFSFLKPGQRTKLHIEDHCDFTVTPEVMIKQWRVITTNEDIRTNGYIMIDYQGNNIHNDDIIQYLSKVSPLYVEYIKQLDVWDKYSKLKDKTHSYFAGGTRFVFVPKRSLIKSIARFLYFKVYMLIKKQILILLS